MPAHPSARLSPAPTGTDPVGGRIPVDQAIAYGLELCWPVTGHEKLQLHDAHGRVLFYAVRNRHALPPFDCSAVDGYALRLTDLTGDGPWTLPRATGHATAGSATPQDWPKGTTLRIDTGAPLPEGCDVIVTQEGVTRHPSHICLQRHPESGANIRRHGTDLPDGALLADAGRIIDPRLAAVLAATGQAQVTVRRPVLVALFSIGSELRAPGQRLGPGQIWNANRYHLAGSLARPWIDVMDLGTVPDQPKLLRTTLERATYAADLVISTGGIANGVSDHLPAALSDMGADLRPMRLALKPSKPLLLGRVGKAVHLGLPGNPVSAFMTWHVIGARLIEALAGLATPDAGLKKRVVRADFTLARIAGEGEILPARLHGHDSTGIPLAKAIQPEAAHRLAVLAQAEGLIYIQPETASIARGDLIEFLPL